MMSVKFIPKPPAHFPAKYTKGGGTTGIDMYQKNPQLASKQTIRVTSAYRNPERNENIGSAALASRHMLGRALDISVNHIGVYGTKSRGVAFYKAWEVIHRLNADTDATYDPLRKAVSTKTKGASDSVPFADRWALETGGSKNILVSNTGAWVVNKAKYHLDNNQNGVLDGYEQAGHLHIQDNPNEGVYK